MIYWFLGIPGSGKSHVARQFSLMTGIAMYEGDAFHTEEDRAAVAAGTFTLQHRHAQLARISFALEGLRTTSAIVTHPLPDKMSRMRVLSSNRKPGRLIYVTAPLPLIRERLRNRKDHHFGPELLDPWLIRHWEEPEDEKCFVIENDGKDSLLESRLSQLRLV